MISTGPGNIVLEFYDFIGAAAFPCVAAKAAMSRDHIRCLVADHFECPAHDRDILLFLYDFMRVFRRSHGTFHSAAIFFKAPQIADEETFDRLLWAKLQSLSRLDAAKFPFDNRVSSDPASPAFSFSLGAEAFFVIGLHPASSRPSRRFKYPAIVFNPHAQFENLRKLNRYEKIKRIVRERDLRYSGSVNPMLSDFGERSEVLQYSGRHYDDAWQCPLKITHGQEQRPESQPDRTE